MKKYSTTAIQSALSMILEKNTKDRYIDALWSCQALELHVKVLLSLSVQKIQKKLDSDFMSYKPNINYSRSNLDDLIKRLNNFYPKSQHLKLMSKLIKARDKRNTFIHGVFQITKGEYKILNFNTSPEQHPESVKVMDEWISTYSDARQIVLEYISKFKMEKIQFRDILNKL